MTASLRLTPSLRKAIDGDSLEILEKQMSLVQFTYLPLLLPDLPSSIDRRTIKVCLYASARARPTLCPSVRRLVVLTNVKRSRARVDTY